MAFDLDGVRAAVAQHGTVARVVIAEVAGSSPREVGASMLVWKDGQSGTIGGGALEFQAAQQAFRRKGLTRHPLGPELGQCCGGAVTLLTEHFSAHTLPDPAYGVFARGQGEMPMHVRRTLNSARATGQTPESGLCQSWMVEPLYALKQAVWIWGAGHVGRALVSVLVDLPQVSLTWVDTSPDRFPDPIPEQVTSIPAAHPEHLMARAPAQASHLIMTYSHTLDLQLCHAALGHAFSFAGVIGSKTKAARFRKRLRSLGHSDAQIERLTCPIGQKLLGKHPQAIAIGVAAQLLTLYQEKGQMWPTHCCASKG